MNKVNRIEKKRKKLELKEKKAKEKARRKELQKREKNNNKRKKHNDANQGNKKRKKGNHEHNQQLLRINDFFDMISPSIVKFRENFYVLGNTYRCVWAIREYPTETDIPALFKAFGNNEHVNIKIYNRQVSAAEENKLIQNTFNKNHMSADQRNNYKENIEAKANIDDTKTLVQRLHKDKEIMVHVAVYFELIATSKAELERIQISVKSELTRMKIKYDELVLRQREGFMTMNPAGSNMFDDQFERIMPSMSAANLFPFNYIGKNDKQGLPIGKDKYGTNIIVDFNRRTDDKTNANILILGNPGQGKSYLMKLILYILRMQGYGLVQLDPEIEYKDEINNLNGSYINLMEGKYFINVLEPKIWSADEEENQLYDEEEDDVPAAFKFKVSARLSQHISFLRDFFLSYKNMSDEQLDIIEIFISKLYNKFGIDDMTDFSQLNHTDYPILSDLYNLIDEARTNYREESHEIYTVEQLRQVCLSLRSICVGSDSRYFNGHTNIKSEQLIGFGVKELLDAAESLKNAMLFNILSYMSDLLLTKGEYFAGLDEFYLFLSNERAVKYVRNMSKRVRKKDSGVIIASQNLDDFNQKDIEALTRPLFAIPTHRFLFYPGSIDSKFYMNNLQIKQNEFDLIKFPKQGTCLFKSGNETFLLQVKAPSYVQVLFGTAGGR